MNTDAAAKAELMPLIIADIYQLAGELRGRGEALAGAVGQTQARWQVLSAASAEPKTVPQIARRLGVTRQGVQRLANLLQRENLADFVANPDHKGSPYVVPTPRGRATLARLAEAAARHHRAIAERLDHEDLQQLHERLRRLIAALRRSTAEE
jgi:DNA-binding MarR family transcriptional regulator